MCDGDGVPGCSTWAGGLSVSRSLMVHSSSRRGFVSETCLVNLSHCYSVTFLIPINDPKLSLFWSVRLFVPVQLHKYRSPNQDAVE